MDVIKMARELGAAIQADERYTFFMDVKTAMDNDETLQNKIGAFNLERMNLDNELMKDDKNNEVVKALNDNIKTLYNDIMTDKNMQKYDEAKGALTELISQINAVIDASVSGNDPLTCDLTSCTHDCSTCGGCG
jgi:cell fate (sporulation/competence/biofilm development) regulator YlbF (YheA/YmcA/DUF963 family)